LLNLEVTDSIQQSFYQSTGRKLQFGNPSIWEQGTNKEDINAAKIVAFQHISFLQHSPEETHAQTTYIERAMAHIFYSINVTYVLHESMVHTRCVQCVTRQYKSLIISTLYLFNAYFKACLLWLQISESSLLNYEYPKRFLSQLSSVKTIKLRINTADLVHNTTFCNTLGSNCPNSRKKK